MAEPSPDGTGRLLSRRTFLALGASAAAGISLAAGARPATAATSRPGQVGDRSAAALARPRLSPDELDAIVSVRIHPGLGIGRVGNAKDAFFLGPEVQGATVPSPADLRDANGAVARQAQRYRIFGFDADGDVVGEVTAADATIDWSVHLANRKAAWYRFGRAMDIPEAATVTRRNAAVKQRGSLVLDAGRKHANPGGSVTLKATVRSRTLVLGELLTDDDGRLIVLPGRGRSTSWNGKPASTFANNDAWLDDIADGPVDATVTIGTRTLDATGAWFVSAPPNYAPAMATGWRTMLDLVEDTWVSAGWMKAGDTVSFQQHIRPLFTRLAALQWVNAGILRDHGWRAEVDLSSPDLLARLADPSVANRPFRKRWARRFRDLESGATEPDALPPILGDVAGVWSSPRAWTGATRLQLYRLDEWAAGRFTADSIEAPTVPEKLADLPLRQRPRSLDRAALDGCLAEAFDPGCELPWILRRKRFWAAPFRVKRRGGPEPDFGPTLTPSEAIGAKGPLNGSVPGAITRWLGVPWQTDTISCRTGYRPTIDTLLDTFWAGRVPNHVLTQADYAIVMDTKRPLKQRRAAFRRRKAWWRGMLTSSYVGTLNRMVNRWDEMGFVMERPGPGDAPFPASFGVEMGRRLAEPSTTAALPPNRLPRDIEGEP